MQIPDFKLERYFARYEFSAPYLLCCSDCESFSVSEILEMEPGAAGIFYDLWLGYTESKGEPVAFPSLKGRENAEEFCDNLVRQAGILLMPGTLYGPSYTKNFRIGFGRKNLPECIQQLELYLDSNPREIVKG